MSKLKSKGPTVYKGGGLNGHSKNYGKSGGYGTPTKKMNKGGVVRSGRKK
tara:strand:- start:187 stop:336 length:150 start_codon:yes stop_codon:yes gene_type:complete